ncbi:hypothetical protein E3N88_42196 [Mikania micrantha]|uniref:PHD-type domain-containing protein n=1 Tax=Mikania micrantha TaxID=192012 RepID=A0A5N6LIE7_9ASTR|nr:hypothetical protein E3N88_42196 [Mikania micrantha]
MEHSSNSSVAGTSGRSVALEIDLNEAPLPSPRELAGGGGGFVMERRCGSCGEVEGAMVVCGDCGRRFHVECLGVREEQRGWKCFECLIECHSVKRLRRAAAATGGGSGLFDMNASPPRGSRRSRGGLFRKFRDLTRNPFWICLSSPKAHPDMRFIATGSPYQNAACTMPRFAHINLETATRKGNLVYLQALKDYISEKQGVLGDGWLVKFEYSERSIFVYDVLDGGDTGPFSEYVVEDIHHQLLGKKLEVLLFHGPINSIPDKILTVKELEASCKVLRKWLELDRCGLDAEFVQELIEQLPGVTTCSKYKSWLQEVTNLSSQTVGSGFFMVLVKMAYKRGSVK